MDTQTLAAVLLSLRIIAVILLVAVIIKQIKQLRTTSTEYPAVRVTIFVLTIVLLLGQFIPILLDAVVTFGSSYTGRSSSPSLLPTSYALNNAGKDVIIGALLAFLYYRPRLKR